MKPWFYVICVVAFGLGWSLGEPGRLRPPSGDLVFVDSCPEPSDHLVITSTSTGLTLNAPFHLDLPLVPTWWGVAVADVGACAGQSIVVSGPNIATVYTEGVDFHCVGATLEACERSLLWALASDGGIELCDGRPCSASSDVQLAVSSARCLRVADIGAARP